MKLKRYCKTAVLALTCTLMLGSSVSLAGNGHISKVTIAMSTITIDGTIDGTGWSNPLNVKIYAYKYYQDESVLNESNLVKGPESLANQGSSTPFSYTINRYAPDGYDRLYMVYVLAVHNGSSYSIYGNCRYPEGVKGISQWDNPVQGRDTYRGFGTMLAYDDAKSMGIGHYNMNIVLNYDTIKLAPDANTITYVMEGKEYYFNKLGGYGINALDNRIKDCTDNGISVYMILLFWNMVYPAGYEAIEAIIRHPDADDYTGSTPRWSAPNVRTEDGVNQIRAIIEFYAERYSRSDKLYGRIDGMTVGNEIPSAHIWTNMGSKTVTEYMKDYIKGMRLVHYAQRKFSTKAVTFISFDHFWNDSFVPGSYKYYKGKDVLDILAQHCADHGDFDWGINWHAYAGYSGNTVWNDPDATLSYTSNLITGRNIELLSSYMNQETTARYLYNGNQPRRIFFGEHGYRDTHGTTPILNNQAASFCYFYWKMLFTGAFDGWAFYVQVDYCDECNSYGMWTRKDGIPWNKRQPIYDTARDIDEDTEGVTAFAKSIIGISNWEQIMLNDSSVTTPAASQVAGTEFVTITTIVDNVNDSTVKLRVEYSLNGGKSFHDGYPHIDTGYGVQSGYGSPSINNNSYYQIRDIPTSSGANTVTFRWDAFSESNGMGSLAGIYQPDVVIRVKASNGAFNGINRKSTVFEFEGNMGPPVSVPSAVQATDGLVTLQTTVGSGYGTNCKMKVDYSLDSGVSWTSGDPHISSIQSATHGSPSLDNGAEYQVTGIDTDSGDNTLTFVWDTKSLDNGTGSLDNTEENGVVIRVTANDGTDDGIPGQSVVFAVDNKSPAVLFEVGLTVRPQAGESAVTVSASFTESSPGTNMFYTAINGGVYGLGVEGENGTASPTAQSVNTGVTLDGDDYISGVKCEHIDAYGNEGVNETLNPSMMFVKPYKPPVPIVDNNATTDSVEVTVNRHGSEALGLEYCIYEGVKETKYVQENGTLDTGDVWQTRGEWGIVSGIDGKITVTGLTGLLGRYGFRVKSRNPGDIGVESNYSELESSGGFWEQTSDTDFNAGTTSDTVVSGTGDSAYVELGSGGGGAFEVTLSIANGGEWPYRKAITVDSSALQTEYQVKLTEAQINFEGHAQGNCDDVRFTDFGDNELSYWFCSAGANSGFWVKVPTINSGDTTIYVYYGNPSAGSVSDYQETLVDYDNVAGFSSVQGQNNWYYKYHDGSYDDMTWNGGTSRWNHPTQLQCIIANDWQHPEGGLDSVRAWYSASYRVMKVTGMVRKASTGGGNGVICYVYKGSSQLWSYTLAYDESTWMNYDLDITDTAGEYMYFRLNNNAGSSYDTTNWETDLWVRKYANPEPAMSNVGSEETSGTDYALEGTFESASHHPETITSWDWVQWTENLTGLGTGLKFQLATGITPDPVNYRGPDGQTTSYYSNLAGEAIWDGHASESYIRYRAYLTDDDGSETPVLEDMLIVYSVEGLLAAPSVAYLDSVTTNSITAHWTDNSDDENGFVVQESSGSGFNTEYTVGADVTSRQVTGLDENVEYSYRVKAQNAAGESGYSNTAAVYTLPVTPDVSCGKTAGTWYNVSTFTFTNVAGFGEGGVGYYRYAWNQNAIYAIWTDTETAWTDGVLYSTATAEGSCYLHVKSYNDAGTGSDTTTDYGPYMYDGTAPDVGVVGCRKSVGGDVIEAADWQDDSTPYFEWDEPASESLIEGYRYILTMDVGETLLGLYDLTDRYVDYSEMPLGYGVHYFRAQARDLAGNEGMVSGFEIWVDTGAGGVVASPSGLAKSEVSKHAVRLNWTGGLGNNGYDIERSSGEGTAGYTVIAGGISETFFEDAGLKAGTSYWYRVYGYDGVEKSAEPSDVENVYTKEVQVVKNVGGEVQSEDEKVTVVIEEGTFNGDVYINIVSTGGAVIEAAMENEKFLKVLGGTEKDIKAKNLLGIVIEDFLEDMEIRLEYDRDALEEEKIDEESLRIYVLDEENEEWEKVSGEQEVNTKKRYVRASVGHFSVYCLIGAGEEGSFDIQELANYPNPATGETVFSFKLTQMAEVKVRVYTLSGRLVWEHDCGELDVGYNEVPEGSAAWNLEANGGGELASGVYLYRVIAENEEGKVNRSGKLVIIR